jgi:hypothetical protein
LQELFASTRGVFRPSLAFVAALVSSIGLAQTGGPADGLGSDDWSSIRQVYDAGRHAAHPVQGGHRAHNPGQRWHTRFDGRGFTTKPDQGAWTWGLELERYGFAGRERLVARPSHVSAEGGRVTYDWDDTLQEWFVNDTRGLEHGYTVHQRPSNDGRRHGALTFTLTVRGELAPEVQEGGRDVRFLDDEGALVLTYSGLTVFDADGDTLPAHFAPVPEGLLLTVDEGGARYPSRPTSRRPTRMGTTSSASPWRSRATPSWSGRRSRPAPPRG